MNSGWLFTNVIALLMGDVTQSIAPSEAPPPPPPPLVHPTPAFDEVWLHKYNCRDRIITIGMELSGNQVVFSRYQSGVVNAKPPDLVRWGKAFDKMQIRTIDVSCTDEFETIRIEGLKRGENGEFQIAVVSAIWKSGVLGTVW
jgi:hypothetical protein